LPPDPEEIVIHDCALVAVQAQPAPAVTVTEPVPPDAATDCESGEIANAQPFPWVIVTVWSATMTVPDRDGPFSAATLTVTAPDPLPFGEDAIVIQG
jgi:hypothetical protein